LKKGNELCKETNRRDILIHFEVSGGRNNKG